MTVLGYSIWYYIFFYLLGLFATWFGYHYERGRNPFRYSDEPDTWDNDPDPFPCWVFLLWFLMVPVALLVLLLVGGYYLITENDRIISGLNKLKSWIYWSKKTAFYMGRKYYVEKG